MIAAKDLNLTIIRVSVSSFLTISIRTLFRRNKSWVTVIPLRASSVPSERLVHYALILLLYKSSLRDEGKPKTHVNIGI